MMDRVVFLDFDGVVNNPGTYGSWRGLLPSQGSYIPVESACIERLNQIVARTSAKIVISSSWRMLADYQSLGSDLVRQGVVGEVIGETPRPDRAREVLLSRGYDLSDALPYQYRRGMEIWTWLLENPLAASIDECVILDDDNDMWRMQTCLVQTDGSHGLRDVDVERAIELFPQSADVIATIRDHREKFANGNRHRKMRPEE